LDLHRHGRLCGDFLCILECLSIIIISIDVMEFLPFVVFEISDVVSSSFVKSTQPNFDIAS